jgi:hypothetical protein
MEGIPSLASDRRFLLFSISSGRTISLKALAVDIKCPVCWR